MQNSDNRRALRETIITEEKISEQQLGNIEMCMIIGKH